MLLETEKDNDHRVSLMWSLRNKKCTNKQTRPKKKKKKKDSRIQKTNQEFPVGMDDIDKGLKSPLIVMNTE